MDSFSFDLKAATDRWPLVFIFELFQVLFDRSFASAVVNSALATNLFYIPFLIRKGKDVPSRWISFVAGQPLGYRSLGLYLRSPIMFLCGGVLSKYTLVVSSLAMPC
ncbi:UNVERIFIED_CONTAM: putative mitochondrial protein [Sesamum calycinum]|uniref:Mitochondrial protein n=1 Tax=Sesamum calycinum TaxID=2727403 RepID=A0AAW2KNF2_9LAMI